MLEIRNLYAGYGGAEILRNISLSIPAGKMTIIVGPNGCGKTTLLKAVAGLIPLSKGEILLDDFRIRDLPPRELARRIAYLPQNRPIPDITAERMVLHGRFPYLSYPRRYRRTDLEIARNAMETLGISDLADRYVGTLSGGQRQKVYIAMALAQETPVILMDEPTTFLDIAHQLQMMEQARFLADGEKTVVMVLHDLSAAMKCADQLVVMSDGEILAQGTPEKVFAGDTLEKAFSVRVARTQTPDGWQYYYGV